MEGIQEANVFVLKIDDNDPGEDGTIGEDIPLPLTLPFETCWFEPLKGVLATWQNEKGIKVFLKGILLEEKAPGIFNYIAYVETDTTNAVYTLYDNDDLYDKSPVLKDLAYICKNTVALILNKLNQTTVAGLVKNNERIKLKIRGEKHHHKIKEIIYIMPKKDRQASIPGIGQVNWTHRWRVRGHWRKLEAGIGKNRGGEYCIHGFTWITEFEKGPESAPLIAKKTRLITGSEPVEK